MRQWTIQWYNPDGQGPRRTRAWDMPEWEDMVLPTATCPVCETGTLCEHGEFVQHYYICHQCRRHFQWSGRKLLRVGNRRGLPRVYPEAQGKR